MPNKQYRGFVVAAPPRLNPKQEPDLYVFSGVEVPNGGLFACSFRSLPVPGFVMPDQFAADVAAQTPLPGNIELFAPVFDLGKFRYTRPNGDNVSARADDAQSLSMDQLRGPGNRPGHEPPEPSPRPTPKPGPRPLPPAPSKSRTIEDDFGPSF